MTVISTTVAVAMRDEQRPASAVELGVDGRLRRSPGVHSFDDLSVVDAPVGL
jgi:hypothetical protein